MVKENDAFFSPVSNKFTTVAGAILGLGLLLMLRGIIAGIAELVSMYENRLICSVEIIQLKQMDRALDVGLISIGCNDNTCRFLYAPMNVQHT